MTNVYGGENNTFFNGSTENGPHTGAERDEKGELLAKYNYFSGDNGPGNYYFRWWKWSLDMLGVTDGVAPSVTVVSNVNVSFTNSGLNANKEFGKTNGTVDGLFGQAYTLGNLEISVTTGSEGKPLSDYGLKVDSITLNYQYDKTESLENVNNEMYKNKYGSYTVEQGAFNNLIEGDAGKKVYSLASSDVSKYTLAPAASNKQLSVAGSYKATSMVVTIVSEDDTGTPLKVVLDNEVLSTAPKYSVSSMKMDAKIDSFAPNKTGYLCIDNGKNELKTVSSSINANKTEVMLYCEMQKNGNNFTILTDPYVTLKLFNKAVAGEVKLQFSGDTTRMYEAARGTENTAYVWSVSSGDTCTRYIGYYKQSKTCSSAEVEPAGTLTATELTVTLDGITYMVAIDTITIKNPAA